MKKQLVVVTLAMVLGLCACGDSDIEVQDIEGSEIEEQVSEEEESEEVQVTEDAQTEAAEDAESSDDAAEDSVGGWQGDYLKIVEDWNSKHGNDAEVRYELAYVDDDDIPELILTCDDDAWYALDMYTYTDDGPAHMYMDDNNIYEELESPYLSPGSQGKGNAYIEKEGIYLDSHGMMGLSMTTGYRMEGDSLKYFFTYTFEDASWDESNPNPYSYTLEYNDASGKLITIEKTVSEDDYFFDVETVPEAKDLEAAFGFSFENKKTFGFDGALSYEEILSELK